MTESQLQSAILDAAKLTGWHRVHIRPVKQARGWGVPYEGDPGLPDLVLARNGRVLLAELKSAGGKPTVEQIGWLAAAGSHARLWRPGDMKTILAELTA